MATRSPATTRQHSPQRPSWRHGSHAPFVLTEDRTSQAVLLGLFTVTLPAMVYAFAQLWSLVGGKTLTHAIQAFAS